MPKVKLGRNWSTLPAIDGKRTDYADETERGLVLRVSPSGVRTYAVRYSIGSKDIRYTIGDAARVELTDARKHARKLLAQAELGTDPQAAKVEARRLEVEKPLLVRELADRFLEHAKLRPSTRKQWTWIAANRLDPIRDRPAADVTRSDVRELLRPIAAKTPVMANRVHELVHRIYSWAVVEELVGASPCVGLGKPTAEKARERVLSTEELRALVPVLKGRRLSEDGEKFGTLLAGTFHAEALYLLLLTGARKTEVTGMAWAELDLEAGLWRIPADRSKTGATRTVPISSPAVAILEARQARQSQAGAVTPAWVFPSPRAAVGPISSLQTTQADVVKAVAKLEERRARTEAREYKPMPGWRVHDLRRTCRTGLAALGVAPHVAEAVLGHAPAGIVRTYNRHEPVAEMRSALEAWGAHLEGLAAGEQRRADVLPMVRRS